jgi:hypothetical protein
VLTVDNFLTLAAWFLLGLCAPLSTYRFWLRRHEKTCTTCQECLRRQHPDWYRDIEPARSRIRYRQMRRQQ